MRNSVIVAFTNEDLAWIEDVADDLALEVSDVVRMLVRKARKAGQTVNTNGPDRDNGQTAQHDAEQAKRLAEEAKRLAHIELRKAELRKQLAALDGQLVSDPEPEPDDFEVPPDPDGGVASEDVASLLSQASDTMNGAPRHGPPGSLFRPVGVNTQVGSGYQQGDAVGNLTRQNFGHLGFSGGTRG